MVSVFPRVNGYRRTVMVPSRNASKWPSNSRICRVSSGFFKEKGGGGGGSHTEPNRGYSPDCCVDLHALLLLM